MPEHKMPQVPGGGAVNVVGLVQGLVIGDHNTVNQTFKVTSHAAYVAQESPPVPDHWIERGRLVRQAVSAVQAGSVVALCGMGGSGKSTLAARITTEVAARFPAGCFWIDLAAGDLDEALLRIALSFGHDISLLKSRQDRARTVHSLLTGQPALLVLDDAWSLTDTEVFLPLPKSCAALVTTRNDAIAASVATTDVLQVEELAEDDAIALLAAVSGTPPSEPLLRKVAGTLGHLPLALELAGRLARQQARRPGFSWEEFADSLREGSGRLALGLAGKSVRAAFEATWTRALAPEAQRAFALLGIFKAGNIFTAEAASAWQADEHQALACLNQLIDLSLVSLLDRVTIRLHPLLADYARAMLENRGQDERIAASCRVCDYLFQAIPRPLQTLSDMATLLRSHYHAAMAGDSERAGRVYPWFDDGSTNIAVSGFLMDHGQFHSLAELRRRHLRFSENRSAWSRSFEYFHLGEALSYTGELKEAEECLLQAVTLMDGPGIDENDQSLGLGKFLMGLGQIQAQMGKLDDAEASFQRMVDFDRRIQAGGKVTGAHDGALTGLLQLADLHAQSARPDGSSQAERLSRAVYSEAGQYGLAHIAVMALARLTNLYERANPEQALATLHLAREIGESSPAAFSGRQGARYARRLAESAAALALNGKPALEDALELLCQAISNAGQSEAWQELGHALYQLGNLFEHYFLIGRESPLTAAWACYALSEAYLKENEGGSPLHAQSRIEQRIIPRIAEPDRAAAAAAVAAEPWGLIEAELSPRRLGWRPGP